MNKLSFEIQRLTPQKDDLIVVKLGSEEQLVTEEDIDGYMNALEDLEMDCRFLIVPYNPGLKFKMIKHNEVVDELISALVD